MQKELSGYIVMEKYEPSKSERKMSFTCKRLRTNDIKEMAEKKLGNGEYDEAMIQRLIDLATETLEGMTVEEVDEDVWNGIWQSWDVDDPYEWSQSEVISDYEDYCERIYESWKDEQ